MAGAAGAGRATQDKPVEVVEHAVRTWPSAPTERATGVSAEAPVTMAPLPLMQERGMAGAAQNNPVEVVEQAVRTSPSEPTGKTTTVPGAVAVRISPFAVNSSMGI